MACNSNFTERMTLQEAKNYVLYDKHLEGYFIVKIIEDGFT